MRVNLVDSTDPVYASMSKHCFCLRYFKIYYLNLIHLEQNHHSIIMVSTRSQLENLSKKELKRKFIGAEDISSKLSDLTNLFDDFWKRHEIL